MNNQTIVIDYAEDEPIVSGVSSGEDATQALRRPVGGFIVRNSNLADKHPTVRDAVAEMEHCGYRVSVES
ncbi:hypothetical protein [Paraburkholderia tropica]|uniref:hypothetical protein n=1 Tax=Paraburkholderia tropica TaxID=92647 RepID=UPI002AB70BCE|nr:hypothetical protein [Paraburkholderia tropica]